jgi:putative protein-disulfide isomerase
MSTTITYLFDPLCGWCYGASPAVQKLGQQSGVTLELAPTGLFADGGRRMDTAFAEFAWSNDLRIAQLTGQRFTEAYRQNVLGRHGSPFDSAAMTLALTAVSLTESQRELDALKTFQEARYVDAAADRLAAADAELMERNAARLGRARRVMRLLGAQGVPALVVHSPSGDRLLGGHALYGDFDHLLGQIVAG